MTEWFEDEAFWELSTRVRDDRARAIEFSFNLYSGPELRGLLRAAGFEAVRLHGGLDGRAYDVDAARLVAVAQAAR